MIVVPPNAEVTPATKLEFLKRADSYPDRPAQIELIETHFAWLFLAGQYTYKLKKPIRFHEIDFTTLERRRRNCESELKLNRRLAELVYIAVVALRRTDSMLVLGSDRGPVADWLVKMHRLPREQMLDARAAAGPVASGELRKLVAKLAAFYAATPRAAWDGPEYRRHLERQIALHGAELLARRVLLDVSAVERIVGEQLRFLRNCAVAIEARCTLGRVVDTHGDLRPEHILLGDDPQIIDCLEFSAQLRLLDTAEEITFLELECAQLGKPQLGRTITDLYRDLCGDALPDGLHAFYYSRRALVRALLCAWHLDEPASAERRRHWQTRAAWYLEEARGAMARAA